MNYEELLLTATKENISIIEFPFKGKGKGYYCDDCIALNSNLNTEREKKCILAEELGHFYTSHGAILNKSINSIKQENRARRWACEKLITINSLIDAFNSGIQSKSELIDFFDVTEEFLDTTISFFKRKYGTHYIFDNYIIFFEPNLSILKKF